LLLDLFWLHYGDCYAADDCLRYVFGRQYAAINAIYTTVSLELIAWRSFYIVLFIFTFFLHCF